MQKYIQAYFQFIKKFLPSESAKSSVGLDVGEAACKLVEVVRSGQDFELIAWDVEPIQGADLATPVKTVCERAGITSKSPYTAIAGKGSLVRFLDLPRMNVDDLKRSFSVEAEKHFPFPADQIYTDCHPLETGSKGKKVSVVAAAAKRNVVDERVRLMNRVGLQPHFIGMNSIALMNVVKTFGFSDDDVKDEGIALIDLGDSVTCLNIFINQNPVFTRDIFIGGRDFTHKIQNVVGVTLEEAERLKRDAGDEVEKVTQASEMVMTSILQEIKLSIEYFSSEKACEVKKVYLAGGGAFIPGLMDYFSKSLGLSLELWNPVRKLKISKDVNQDELKKESPKLGAALGLALYDYV